MSILYVIGILIAALILLWLAFWVLQQFPLGDPIDRILRVVIVVIAVLVIVWALLSAFGVLEGGPHVRLSGLSVLAIR